MYRYNRFPIVRDYYILECRWSINNVLWYLKAIINQLKPHLIKILQNISVVIALLTTMESYWWNWNILFSKN